MPMEDDEMFCKMSFPKRLSVPLISSLIFAFMHPSAVATATAPSSSSSKKCDRSLQPVAATEIALSVTGTAASGPNFRANHQRSLDSETVGVIQHNTDSRGIRRSSCPETGIPGFAKHLAVKNFLGVVPVTSLTQLAGPPIPVMPLGRAPPPQDVNQEQFLTPASSSSSSSSSSKGRQKSVDVEEEKRTKIRPIVPGEKAVLRLRRDAASSLGVSLIGGCETSLGVLQVHEIFPEGAVAVDGRLLPGDRILAVNGDSLVNLPYSAAVAAIASAFSGRTPVRNQAGPSSPSIQTSPTHRILDASFMTLVVERPGSGVQTNWYDQEITVDLLKRPGRGLGLCIAERAGPVQFETNGLPGTSMAGQQSPVVTEHTGLGVIISDLIRGSTAYLDGRMMKGDQILSINGINVINSSQEEIATLLKGARGILTLRLGRLKGQPVLPDSVAAAFVMGH